METVQLSYRLIKKIKKKSIQAASRNCRKSVIKKTYGEIYIMENHTKPSDFNNTPETNNVVDFMSRCEYIHAKPGSRNDELNFS